MIARLLLLTVSFSLSLLPSSLPHHLDSFVLATPTSSYGSTAASASASASASAPASASGSASPTSSFSSSPSPSSSSSSSSSRLISVILISRHGTRAPNPVLSQLCPGDAPNLALYDHIGIEPAGVTGRGMQELLSLGQYTHHAYVESEFLAPFYRGSETYIKAVAEDRTLQSAVAFGHSFYPPGSAATDYSPSLPTPLPIYSLPNNLDNLLEIRKAACKHRLAKDVKIYDATEGKHLLEKHRIDVIGDLEGLCKTNLTQAIVGSGDDLGDALKDITDAFMFDSIESFPTLPGLTLEKLLKYRTVAVEQLIGRILGTDDQISYLNGDLPQTIWSNFHAHVDPDQKKKKLGLKFAAYHGHREMMYALAKFFTIELDIQYPALPKGAIPPGTTFFFELRERIRNEKDASSSSSSSTSSSSSSDFFVRPYLWTPCHDPDSMRNKDGILCLAKTTRLTLCPSGLESGLEDANDCRWDDFGKIVSDRFARTGDWTTLCTTEAVNAGDGVAPQEEVVGGASTGGSTTSYWVTVGAVLVVGVGFGWAWKAWQHKNHSGYQSIA